MMKKLKIIMFICFCLGFTLPLLAADKNIDGYVGVGAFLQGDSDALDRAAEYYEDESSPSFKAYLDTYSDSSDFYLKGNYEGEYTNDLEIKGNFLRLISVDLDYNQLFHRKDYDRLFIDYDKTNFSPLVAMGKIPASAKPDGQVWGINKFISNDTVTSPGGQWFGFEQDSSAVDKDYYIKRREVVSKASLAMPNLETLKLNFSGRFENREGYEHKTAMVGKCTACHVRGLRKHVDETTRDLTAGVSYVAGPVSMSYSHMKRDFYVSNSSISTSFDNVEGLRTTMPDKYIAFAPRLNSETYGTTAEVAKTPESTKDMDTIKLKVDLPSYTTFAGSFTTSNISNDDTYSNEDVELDQDALNLRLTTHLLDRKLSLSTKFRYVELDRDYISAELQKNEAYYFQPAFYKPVNLGGVDYLFDKSKAYFNTVTGEPIHFHVEGDSTYNREQYLTGLDTVYRLSKKLKFRLGYEYESIDRDNYDVYYNETQTERNTFKAGIDFKPITNFTGRLNFKYSDINSPFAHPDSGCIQLTSSKDPSVIYSGSGAPAAYPLVYDLRNYTGSTSPSEIYDYSLNLSWLPVEKLSLSLFAKYLDTKNDEGNTNWDYDAYNLGFDGSFMFNEKFVLSFGYSYEIANTDSKLSVGMYAG